MNRLLLALALLIGSSVTTLYAQKEISLKDIWRRYTFVPKSVPGFNFLNDGRHYTRMERNTVNQYDLGSGELVAVLFQADSLATEDGFDGNMSGYSFSPDEKLLLIESGTEYIYRRSSRANFFIYDRDSRQLSPVFEGEKVMYATVSPDGKQVAFVFRNDLYVQNLTTGEVTRITSDGEQNKIINGAADWVYEEEFSIARGFEWSPDSRRIAFLRWDEREVKEFTMTNYMGELYPHYETFKYPKVGERNATVTAHIYDIQGEQLINVDAGADPEMYLPRIRWTQNPAKLCVVRMNRHQNEVELLLANASDGSTSLLYKESNQYYIEESQLDNLVFLENGEQFVWTSEKSGFRHIYLYDMQGNELRAVTEGDWEVSSFYGVDEDNGKVYYQAAEKSPLQRQVYEIGLNGKGKKTLAGAPGWNSAQFSSTYDYFVLNHSTANTASTYGVYDRRGKLVREIENNAGMAQLQEEYGVAPVEFFDFETSEGVSLNGYMIKPRDFDPSRQYPVFMYLYGGPGSQTVTDRFGGFNYWWFQMLAQQGYIVVSVDNRGTGGRGEEFKKMTYQQLGHYETIDQIEAARYLGNLPYTDKHRIGIFGWSYGGYMSSLCLLKGNDVFKAAIAVAPVTNWKWYDTIYTERYMRTLEENPDGYAANSPVNFADRLRGNYLLVHGNSDDNVHFQQTAEMANALIRANKQYDTYFYPNRNHAIFGGNTRLHLYTKMTNFLNSKLKSGGLDNAPEDSVKP